MSSWMEIKWLISPLSVTGEKENCDIVGTAFRKKSVQSGDGVTSHLTIRQETRFESAETLQRPKSIEAYR